MKRLSLIPCWPLSRKVPRGLNYSPPRRRVRTEIGPFMLLIAAPAVRTLFLPREVPRSAPEAEDLE
jgi:hypothetical protein